MAEPIILFVLRCWGARVALDAPWSLIPRARNVGSWSIRLQMCSNRFPILMENTCQSLNRRGTPLFRQIQPWFWSLLCDLSTSFYLQRISCTQKVRRGGGLRAVGSVLWMTGTSWNSWPVRKSPTNQQLSWRRGKYTWATSKRTVNSCFYCAKPSWSMAAITQFLPFLAVLKAFDLAESILNYAKTFELKCTVGFLRTGIKNVAQHTSVSHSIQKTSLTNCIRYTGLERVFLQNTDRQNFLKL